MTRNSAARKPTETSDPGLRPSYGAPMTAALPDTRPLGPTPLTIVARIPNRSGSPSWAPAAAHSRVAVGTPVARRPPHRSRRAALPHRALTLGPGVKALFRPGMQNAGRGQP